MNGDGVPDISPRGEGYGPPSDACPECPIVDAIERKEQEARMAAWAGILVAILGVLSWNTWGFLICGTGAIVFGLYARRFAPHQARADFAAGAIVLVVLILRMADVL